MLRGESGGQAASAASWVEAFAADVLGGHAGRTMELVSALRRRACADPALASRLDLADLLGQLDRESAPAQRNRRLRDWLAPRRNLVVASWLDLGLPAPPQAPALVLPQRGVPEELPGAAARSAASQVRGSSKNSVSSLVSAGVSLVAGKDGFPRNAPWQRCGWRVVLTMAIMLLTAAGSRPRESASDSSQLVVRRRRVAEKAGEVVACGKRADALRASSGEQRSK
eukprot:TRINITY_DN28370_c0_g1_i1.p1 TRINITY_DN28370_c0_g1~~TRINITY_DN28370_c0_g1_i1.p1  ORF type:complete len:226 (+),score=46.26 TRINITY_DN28370_c0_g1_i1:222-899(+)